MVHSVLMAFDWSVMFPRPVHRSRDRAKRLDTPLRFVAIWQIANTVPHSNGSIRASGPHP